MMTSKFFVITVVILVGLIAQVIPMILTIDSPKTAIGFPFTFLWEGPNEVHVGGYIFEKEFGYSFVKLLFDSIFFIGLAFILERKFRKTI